MILQLVCLIEVRQLAIGINQMQLTLMPKGPVKKLYCCSTCKGWSATPPTTLLRIRMVVVFPSDSQA